MNLNDAGFSRKELLQQCWTEQQAAITALRDREQTIFQLASSVWLSFLAGVVLTGAGNGGFLKTAGVSQRVMISVVILFAAGLVFGWIWKQRAARTSRQRALADIQKQAGCYDSLQGASVLPPEFYESFQRDMSSVWSFKLLMSMLLPSVVLASVWFG
jgi:hypothetical protein